MYLKANSHHAAAAGKSVIGFNIVGGREIEGDLSLIQSKSAVDHRDLVGMFPDSGEKDVARAARAAAEAQRDWDRTSESVRRTLIRRTGDTLLRHREVFARILVREIGMTWTEARAEVDEALGACTFFGSEPVESSVPARLPGGVQRRAVGVCGVLATGSSPLAAPLRKILPALLCGNTVVWKPSDLAPTAGYLLMRVMMEAGLPPGVVNTINGRGRAGCGKHLLAGLDRGLFQAFAFVGSAHLGATVGEACGRNLILPDLDLAGKGSMIVMPDADLDRAAGDALSAAFGQCGQRPLGLSNVLVHEACFATFRERLLDGLASLPQGNPLGDPGVACGPMMSTRLANHFKDLWEAGRKDGAALSVGGEAWNEANRTGQVKGDIAHGAYLQPCVWECVTPGMDLFRQQALGPLLNLCAVPDFDTALAWAAQGASRVSCSLYTQAPDQIRRFCTETPADLAGINHFGVAAEARLPFAGLGTRPGGHPALHGYTRCLAMRGAPVELAAPAPSFLELPEGLAATDWNALLLP